MGKKKPKLTAKQKLFVESYQKHGNAARAAREAGYSFKNADKIGSQLLGKTGVAEEMSAAMSERSARLKIDADWAVRRAAALADSNVHDFFIWKGDWPKLRRKLPRSMWYAVESINVVESPSGRALIKLKVSPKLASIELVARLLGFLENAGPDTTPDALRDANAELDAQEQKVVEPLRVEPGAPELPNQEQKDPEPPASDRVPDEPGDAGRDEESD